MAVTAEEIQRLAQLAKLQLDPQEHQGLAQDISAILTYAHQLQGLDTTDVPPTTHATDIASPLRPDVVQPGLGIEDALANAPDAIGHGFGVPKVIE